MIETERLLLRPFIEKDAADVFEYLREPAVNGLPIMARLRTKKAKR